jgi:ketosteroid isomerase-like protein
MSGSRNALFILFLLFILSTITFSQQWSSEQLDVWKGIQKYWDAGMSDDVTTMLKYWDDSYNGWSYENEAPGTKADVTKALTYWTKKGKEQYHIITPAKIWVNGDFAYAHYYYTLVVEGSDGKPNTEKGRWTDILMKKDGTWLLVGDHGGEIKKD